MLSRMAPSSPPDMRTLHLLRTPDILCANDNRLPGSYSYINQWFGVLRTDLPNPRDSHIFPIAQCAASDGVSAVVRLLHAYKVSGGFVRKNREPYRLHR